jgi:hypothetical protein
MGHMLLLILGTHTNILKNQKKLEKQKKLKKFKKIIYIYIKNKRDLSWKGVSLETKK